MLSFEEKLIIINEFPQLTRKDISLGRINFHFEDSLTDKKNVVYHLHPNGNGFVYVGLLTGYERDDRGFVNIRHFTEKALRSVIEKSISSLSQVQVDPDIEHNNEIWRSESGFTLQVIHEDEMWNVYAGDLLDGTFNTYGEAAEYLIEEGFRRN